MCQKKIMRVLPIVSLIISVIGLIIAVITIEKNMTKSNDTWSIKYQNLVAEKKGTATYVLPTLSDTSLNNAEITFSKEKDSVSFIFEVENNGSLDAILSTIYKSKFTCTGVGSNASIDAANVCSHIKYSLKYDDGRDVSINDLLNQGSRRKIKLTITSNVTPQNIVTVNNLNMILIYHQN